jgi:hypothetical protein
MLLTALSSDAGRLLLQDFSGILQSIFINSIQRRLIFRLQPKVQVLAWVSHHFRLHVLHKWQNLVVRKIYFHATVVRKAKETANWFVGHSVQDVEELSTNAQTKIFVKTLSLGAFFNAWVVETRPVKLLLAILPTSVADEAQPLSSRLP